MRIEPLLSVARLPGKGNSDGNTEEMSTMAFLEVIGAVLGFGLLFAVGLFFQIIDGRILHRMVVRSKANARAARQRADWYRAQQYQNPSWNGGGQYPGGQYPGPGSGQYPGGQYSMPGQQPSAEPWGPGLPGQSPSYQSPYPPPYPPQPGQTGYSAPPSGYGQPPRPEER
jgi:hypothetical protein